MRVVLAFCDKDKAIAIRLAHWIRDLGGVQKHDCLLTVARSTNSVGIIEVLKEAFGSVKELIPYDDSDKYPDGASLLWKRTAEFVAEEKNPRPWFWIEPDAVPLRSTWVDEIEAEYVKNGKPFMHDLVVTPTSQHNSGLGVYPPLVRNYTGGVTGRMLFMLENHSWDVYFSPDFMPHTHHTGLIQDVFWQLYKPDTPPEFPDAASLRYLDPKACIFHRQKSGNLIEQLRKSPFHGPSETKIAMREFDRKREAEKAAPRLVTNRMIYTYFETVPEMSYDDGMELIEIWKREWSRCGWVPVVLGYDDAAKHPKFSEAEWIFSAFPSSNPDGYDLACFNRWLAMSVVGGGWMSDFDVLPVNPQFNPTQKIEFFSGNKRDPLIPCLVHGSKAGYEEVISHFMAHIPKGDHTSDMVALRDFQGETYGGVLEYGDPGWQFAKAVHFSNHSMGPQQPKWEFIPGLLEEARAANPPQHFFQETLSSHAMWIPVTPKSIPVQMREHADALVKLVDGEPARRLMLHRLLREVKLIPKASMKR